MSTMAFSPRKDGWTISAKGGRRLPSVAPNAHRKNRFAEKRLQDLSEATLIGLIHANKRWSDDVETYIWPNAIIAANELHNYTPSQKTGKVPIQEFSQLESDTVMRHFHTFGCRVYALASDLQAGQKRSRHKWEDRAKLSINLGPSPTLRRSISLILNTRTGMIAP